MPLQNSDFALRLLYVTDLPQETGWLLGTQVLMVTVCYVINIWRLEITFSLSVVTLHSYGISWWMGIMENSYTEEWSAILAFMSQLKLSRVESFLARYVFQLAVYVIWRERNSKNYGENPRPLENLFRTIDKMIKNRVMSLRTQDKRLKRVFQVWIAYVGT